MKTTRNATQDYSGIRVMLANPRRLELAIVAAGLLVLMLSSRPPRSGNADIRTGREEMMRKMPASEDATSPGIPAGTMSAVHNGNGTWGEVEPIPADGPPQTKRMGVVDARNCGNPKYKDLMYGEISVRWVWNGHKLVPQKVCIVDEGNGVSSVWSFDQSDGVIVSEIQEPAPTSR